MGAMLRGPTVTILSAKRCQEMRGKIFVILPPPPPKEDGLVLNSDKSCKERSSRNGGENNFEYLKAQLKKRIVNVPGRLCEMCRNRTTISRFIYYARVTFLMELLKSFVVGMQYFRLR